MALSAVQVLAKFRDAMLALDEFAEAGGFDELNKPEAPKTGPAKKTAPARATAKKSEPVEEPEDDDEIFEEEDEIPSEAEAAKMTIRELRDLAKRLGLAEQKVKSGILAELEELRDDDAADEDDDEIEEDDDDTEYEDGVEEEEEEADEEDDDSEEEEEEGDDSDDDEDEGYSREELEGKTLNELRSIAKAEGISPTKFRGMDVEGLIDLIVGDEDEADDGEDAEELDEDALKAMSIQELFELAKELDIEVPRALAKMKNDRTKRAALKTKMVEHILDSAGVDDEGDE